MLSDISRGGMCSQGQTQGRRETYWRDYSSHLTLQNIGILSEEQEIATL